MIVNGDEETYSFEQNEKRIHFPRIFINDIHEVRKLLKLLDKHKILSNEKMTEETTRVRSENPREFFHLLWVLGGLGVAVTRSGKIPVFVATDELKKILKLTNDGLKDLILERLKNFTPFVAILHRMIDFRDEGRQFTQQNITDNFHTSTAPGNLDNTHPLCRWANDDDKGFGLVNKEKKEINEEGIKFVEEANANPTYFFDYDVDLDEDANFNAIVHVLAKASVEGVDTISIKEVFTSIVYSYGIDLKEKQLPEILQELSAKGVPITFDSEQIKINGKIFHYITPKAYTKFGLETIDKITLPKSKTCSLSGLKKIFSKEVEEITIEHNIKMLVIMDDDDEEFVDQNYPESKQIVDYDDFMELESKLPNSNVNTILIPSTWKPKKLAKIIGILIAFVRFGGNLVIENINTPGRLGANENRYAWLCHDICRISSVPNDDKNVKGYFTFNEPERFTFTKKNEDFQEISEGRYSYLSLNYNLGKIIFVTLKNYKEKLEEIVDAMNKIVIDEKSIQWTGRMIPSIKHLPGVNGERHLYPHLRNLMHNEFNFDFDPNITGASGETDLMIIKPFCCCCEVGVYGQDVSTSSKVSEVVGHTKMAKLKDKRALDAGQSPPYAGEEIGSCVLGVSFSKEDGTDSGAIGMAEAQEVSLIRYMDLYELICLNEKYPVTEDEFKKIFFYQEGEDVEAAVRIYDLIQQKNS